MAYKWRPSASQRREFAERMKDPVEKAAYEARKEEKAAKRRAGSRFDYESAGGSYVPTQGQYEFCNTHPELFVGIEKGCACASVIMAYLNQNKVHHDYIHIVNEVWRKYEFERNCGII
jgi:hypothetical protein